MGQTGLLTRTDSYRGHVGEANNVSWLRRWSVRLLILWIVADAVAINQIPQAQRHAVYAQLRNAVWAVQSKFEQGRDLKVGSAVPLARARALSGEERKFPPSGKPTALLFVPSCGSCNAPRLDTWLALADEFPRADVLIVSMSPKEDARTFARDKPWAARLLIPDPQKSLARKYHVYFYPRAFLIDRRGRIAFCQDFTTSFEESIETIANMLRRWFGARQQKANP